ncbi:MAG: efflux RND transporter periplasmic adaptor subunit [Deltaproteobacteria bacterium]|nr:efflux RND transporter periplasmic adaptor subunit [Deltaproteobacteria bacterium]
MPEDLYQHEDNTISLSSLRIAETERAASSNKKSRLILFSVIALAIIVGVIFWLASDRVIDVQVTTAKNVVAGQETTLLNAAGYVTPRRRATIAAEITARVVEMLADEGMAVKAGDILARLDDGDARKQLQAAKAQLEAAKANLPILNVNLSNAERELKRQQELSDAGVASTQALDAARTARDGLQAQLAAAKQQVNVAQANVALTQQQVDSSIVKAPFAGIIVSKDAQIGEMVSPISSGTGYTRTGIATIVDMQSLEVEVDVGEAYIAKVIVGQPVKITLDAYPDWKIPGKVRTVIPTADRQKATVKVRIAFEQLDPRILPDMGVKVAFLSETSKKEAQPTARALLPDTAIHNQDSKTVVFVVNNGRLERRAVQVGNNNAGEVEILAGVSPGDTVVVSSVSQLRDNQAVAIKQ